MNTRREIKQGFSLFVTLFAIIFFVAVGLSSAAVTQFTPSISVSEIYTDNYNQTEHHTDDELSTEYMLDLDFEYIETRGQMNFNYNLSYLDYDDYDENDSWQHYFNFNGLFNLTRHTDLTLTESFLKSRDISQRTGTWEDHDTNNITAGLLYQFGQRNSVGVDLSHSFDKYDDPNPDEYERYRSSAFLTYWFNIKYGLELSAFYEQTEFDILNNEEDTLSGSIKLRRQMTNHFQIYVEYVHSISEDDTEEHIVYNPSIGFEWMVSETSSVSMGAGVLFNRYENQQDSQVFFLDLEVFKLFDFSERGDFAISASSGYGEIDEELASLGFRIYYQVGCNYNYELTRQISLDISGSYLREQFNEERTDRVDNIFNLHAGVLWNPLNWMTFGLSYSFTDFKTDTDARDDFVENRVMLTATFTIPYRSRHIQPENTRAIIEERIFER